MPAQKVILPIPASWSRGSRDRFLLHVRALARNGAAGRATTPIPSPQSSAGLAAAFHIVNDLVDQGWTVEVDRSGSVAATPPDVQRDPKTEKDRVRRQELLKRDEQLASPAVRRFIAEMEQPREFNGKFVSIFSLMRDGAELAQRLRLLRAGPSDPGAWPALIDPYVQVITNGDRCRETGLRLVDIWRYFRHTWTNYYVSTPGRTILILVRDRAAPFHPVIGIAALGSSIVQMNERDRWIGWQPDQFLDNLAASPTIRTARWIVRRLEQGMQEIYTDDLLANDLYWPSLWAAPTHEAIARLEEEARLRRESHHRFVRRSDFKTSNGDVDWRRRAESDLFRSKRCLAIAALLRARMALDPFLYPRPTIEGLRAALDDDAGRRAIYSLVRRAKAEAVGTEIADLTVCGAVAPYSALLGGKLVSMLAVSPTVIRAYHERYRSYTSEIASSVAGRPITRPSKLAFVGTTSLYGSGSSQYNRVRIPRHVLDSREDLRFLELGRSRSFGTSHLSSRSVAALLRLSEQSGNGVRVNSIFGEGVSPKLRKVRGGIDRLGWPSNALLQHHRRRIIYGVPLISNLLPYLLGFDREPRYLYRLSLRDDVQRITRWWIERWLSKRISSDAILDAVAANTTARPVRHGARVPVIATESVES